MSRPAVNTALAEALAAVDIGWWVFPTPEGVKVPFRGSHGFKDASNDPKQVEAWAKQHPRCNWAIATGVRSGLAVLDIDPRRGGDIARLDLPDTATVETPSGGLHIDFTISGPVPSTTDRIGPGIELKSDGTYVLCPGSRTRKGVYRWRNSPADVSIAPLPEWIMQRVRSVAEHAECNLSAFSECSACSATYPDEVINQTLPTRPGERHAKVFDLARGLKFDCGITDPSKAKELVRRWHRLALPIITTKSFDETWSDFLTAFERCKMPLSVKTVDVAADNVLKNDPPEIVANYDDPTTHSLIHLCWELHRLSRMSGGVFFLSSHDVAHRLGLQPMTAWRRLQMLVSDGVLKIVKAGNERRATRYRWTAGEEDE